MNKPFLLAIFSLLLLSCNHSLIIEKQSPRISFPDGRTSYELICGETLRVTPLVEYGEDAQYQWILNHEIVSEKAYLEYVFSKPGSYYVQFLVETTGGKAQAVIEVRVGEAPVDPNDPGNEPLPVITLPSLVQIKATRELQLVAEVAYAEEAVFLWRHHQDTLATTLEVRVAFPQAGMDSLFFSAKNAAGISTDTVRVEVLALEPPTIVLDSVYTAKAGKSFTLVPQVHAAQDAVYAWVMGQDTLSTSKELTYTFTDEGRFALTFSATTWEGTALHSFWVNVRAVAPPTITFSHKDDFSIALGQSFLFTPEILLADEQEVSWKLNGKDCGRGFTYLFNAVETGDYVLEVVALNDDGTATASLPIHVIECDSIPIRFLPSMRGGNPLQRSLFLGQALCLMPLVEYKEDFAYRWSIDGETVGEAPSLFYYPEKEGDFTLCFTVTDNGAVYRSRQVEMEVHCAGLQATARRQATASSRTAVTQVFDYLPAPGQHINEPASGYQDVLTHAQACDYAADRLENTLYVSLGAFGGYLTVGFDHSVQKFAVLGNAIESCSEPGVVWVMQDANGNGLPDDQWYELTGSLLGNKSVYTHYAVTYSRPNADGQPVPWTDSYGKSGNVPYMGMYHTQPTYYPLWVEEDSYTLYGTLLPKNVSQNALTGQWTMNAVEWGYADNLGKDTKERRTVFSLVNARYENGTPVKLDYVDFVKIQSGVQATAGWTGEVSTDVLGVYDAERE